MLKNKVLTISLRTLTSNILLLETKQLLKTSFWEVRLLYFSFFKKSFLKVTQTLLSFLSFFFGQSDWFLWILFSRNFFIFPKSFSDALSSVSCIRTKYYKYEESKKACTQATEACEAYFMLSSLVPARMPSAKTLRKFAFLGKYWYLFQQSENLICGFLTNQRNIEFFLVFFPLIFWQQKKS